ncbi:hypothetical protein [Streptosporangium sp. NBC_01756]|uniref:hypothetical protein n=1 Tax=Streptosporangium sp. NBC_01756 TaxID=2975950 RepID=UPI003FA3722E
MLVRASADGLQPQRTRAALLSSASEEELSSPGSADPQTERWSRVELRVDRLDWLPAVLASLDRPFAIERPDELRGLVEALAERLTHSARRNPPHGPPLGSVRPSAE